MSVELKVGENRSYAFGFSSGVPPNANAMSVPPLRQKSRNAVIEVEGKGGFTPPFAITAAAS